MIHAILCWLGLRRRRMFPPTNIIPQAKGSLLRRCADSWLQRKPPSALDD